MPQPNKLFESLDKCDKLKLVQVRTLLADFQLRACDAIIIITLYLSLKKKVFSETLLFIHICEHMTYYVSTQTKALIFGEGQKTDLVTSIWKNSQCKLPRCTIPI